MTTAPPKRQPIPFGQYLLLDRINIGGMAEVWRGKQVGASGFERLVAIKRILPNIAEDEEFITMFIDEAKITVQLTHANVAQVYELGHIQNSYFIAMEYIAGKDMRAIFDRCRKKGEPAPVPLTCYVVSKLCEGLDYAHRKKDGMGRDMNIVHRDISPQNVLVSYEGEVKVIDFGIAKAAGKATKTQAGILKGKFAYMSPEQIRGLPLDRRSDVFAIGVCLYEMLTGERLFVGDSDFSVLEKVRKAEVTPPSHFNKRVPEALEKIVLKALAKDVEDRYQYANEVADDLQRFLITSDSIFSRKDLMQYMKSTFAEDVEREKIRMQEYAEIQVPEGMRAAAEMSRGPAAPAFSSAPTQAPMMPSVAPQVAAAAPAGPPVLAPAPLPNKTVNLSPQTSGVRRTPSLTSMPKLTAAAPMLSNKEEPNAGATVLSDGSENLVEKKAQAHAARADAKTIPPGTIEATAITQPKSLAGEEAGPKRPSKPKALAPVLPERDPPTRAERSAAPARSSKSSLPSLEDPEREDPPTMNVPPGQLGRLPSRATEPSVEVGGGLAAPARPPWLLFAAIGGAVLVVAIIAGVVLFRPAPQGILLVDEPAGATRAHVRLNDQDLGVPTSWPLVRRLPVGPVVVIVNADGFKPFTATVKTDPQAVTEVRPELKPVRETVPLVMSLTPETAEVRINGKVVKREGERDPLFTGELTAGTEALIEVRRAGFKPFSKKVQVSDPNNPVQVPVKLDALEFEVAVNSDPHGATIFVSGKEVGKTPATIHLAGDVTEVVLKKKCHDDLSLRTHLPDAPGPVQPLAGAMHRQSGCR